ncbi:MAG: hypothetical protein WAQ05_05650 [Rubrivivax sp.]
MHSTDFATLPGNTHVAPKAPRADLYGPIHKALRQFMGHTLQRVGAMDVEDAEERSQVLDGVAALLGFMRGHLAHENDFIHTAIEARRPGGARHTADDHLLHVDAIGNLEDEAAALRVAGDAHRATLAQRLYRHLGEFVGENLVHMQVEETQNNAALWALYSDAEIFAIHDRLVASIAPDEMALATRWLAASLNIHELSGMFCDMQQKAPPPAFEALLAVARTQLDERRWAQLCRALGRAPVPGLMTA